MYSKSYISITALYKNYYATDDNNICENSSKLIDRIININRMYYGQYMDYYDFISASEKSVGRFVDNVANILSRNVGVTNIEVTMFCAELQQIIMLEIATIVSNENFTKPYFNMKNMKEMI